MSLVQRPEALLSKNQPQDVQVKRREEYVTQHLEFTPKSFCDGLYNTVYDYVHDGLDSLQKTIRHESECVIDETELSTGCKMIFEKYVATADKTFDKFEKYITENVLKVPDEVVFPEDLVQVKINSSEARDHELDEEIETLTKEIVKAKYEFAQINQDLLDSQTAIEETKKILSLLESLEGIAEKNNFSDLNEIKKLNVNLNEKMNLISE